ncbi:MAG: right-handed parallel beta-helix repeat-containing protein, partial [Polyangiaceae bacterium]
MSIHRSYRLDTSLANHALTVVLAGSLIWVAPGCSGGEDGSVGDDSAGSFSAAGSPGQSGSSSALGGRPGANGGGPTSGAGQIGAGGSPGIAGSADAGGPAATGGNSSAGGSSGAGGGGRSSSGGAPGASGSAGAGGTPTVGGSSAGGGSAGSGGKPATGGTGGTSGAPGTGGGTACGAGLAPTVSVTTAAQLDAALTNAKGGDVISIAAGTYALSGKSYKLSASNVKIFGSAGKTILDYQATTGTDSKYGIDISGSSNTICGLTFARAADNGIHITGDSNTIDRCEFYECFDSGLQISGPEAETPPHPAKNSIINSDSHDNYDTKASGGNADGFAAKINIGPGNKFFGCVAHDNSDDGWDTFPKTASGTNAVTIENCVAYHNGYHKGAAAGNGNGFKVGSDQTGGAPHVLKNSVAFNNPSKGFDQNHNQGVAIVQNCTGVNNDRNIAFQEYGGASITN